MTEVVYATNPDVWTESLKTLGSALRLTTILSEIKQDCQKLVVPGFALAIDKTDKLFN